MTGRIDASISELKYLIDICERKLDMLPRGAIAPYRSNGRRYYKVNSDGQWHHLKDPDGSLLAAFKEKTSLEELLRRLAHNLECLEKCSSGLLELSAGSVIRSLPEWCRDLPDDIFSDLGYVGSDAFRAAGAVSVSKGIDGRSLLALAGNDISIPPLYPDRLTILTSSGIRVRSRIEAWIADRYTALGVEFRYELPLLLPGGKYILPDFTIFIPEKNSGRDGPQFSFHEHLGMLDDKEYFDAFRRKIDRYLDIDILPGRDLLLTYETADHRLDLNKIEKEIEAFVS